MKTSSGEDAGRIEDVVINPANGRIDFAVISAESKLCPVPWQLLSVSSASSITPSTSTTPGTSPATPGATTTTPSTSGIYAAAMGQPTFTLNVDKSKLQAGPSFDRSRWPEMSASWSQRVFSHYGVQPETGVGGTGTGSTSSQSDPGSSSSDKDKSSDDKIKSSDDKK